MEDLEELPIFEPIVTQAEWRAKEKPIKKPVVRKLEDVEKAVWQYMIDHSTPHKLGYAVTFIVFNKDDFFRRVEARRMGTFKRVDQGKIERKVKKLKRSTKWLETRNVAWAEAKKTGPWWLKYAIKFRKKLTMLIDKYAGV